MSWVYATVEEFKARYATKLTDAEVASHYLPFASSRLEGMLGPYFTVPFSDNNVTAKDLSIDLAYLLILQRSRESGDQQALGRLIEGRFNALAGGTEAMITTSGEALFAQDARQEIWSSTARYKTIFDLSESIGQEVDPARLQEDS